MDTNLIDMASKKWSGIVLAQYFTNIAKIFGVSPLYISDTMLVRTQKDISADDTAIDTTMGAFSRAPIRHTELDEVETKLVFHSIEEPIGITNWMIANEMGQYNLMEFAMAKNAKKLGYDLMAELNTILVAAGTYSAAREIDLSGGTYVKWNLPATAKPRANILELKNKLVDASGVDQDDPRITLTLSVNALRYAQASADYIAYRTADANDYMKGLIQRMKDYFEVPNVVILPSTPFTDIVVLSIVDSPLEMFSISNPNMNQSALITMAYNIASVNQPLNYKMINGLTVTESRAFIGARDYPREDGKAIMADAFTWNKVVLHNENAIARLKNID